MTIRQTFILRAWRSIYQVYEQIVTHPPTQDLRLPSPATRHSMPYSTMSWGDFYKLPGIFARKDQSCYMILTSIETFYGMITN